MMNLVSSSSPSEEDDFLSPEFFNTAHILCNTHIRQIYDLMIPFLLNRFPNMIPIQQESEILNVLLGEIEICQSQERTLYRPLFYINQHVIFLRNDRSKTIKKEDVKNTIKYIADLIVFLQLLSVSEEDQYLIGKLILFYRDYANLARKNKIAFYHEQFIFNSSSS